MMSKLNELRLHILIITINWILMNSNVLYYFFHNASQLFITNTMNKFTMLSSPKLSVFHDSIPSHQCSIVMFSFADVTMHAQVNCMLLHDAR